MKTKLLVGVTILVFAVGGLGGYFYVYPKLSESSEVVIQTAFVKLAEAESLRQESVFSLKAVDNKDSNRSLVFALETKSGFVSGADGQRNFFSELIITDQLLTFAQGEEEIAFFASLVDLTNLKAESRGIGSDLYFRLSGLNAIGSDLSVLSDLFDLDLNIYLQLINNRWIKYDNEINDLVVASFSKGEFGELETEENHDALIEKTESIQNKVLSSLSDLDLNFIRAPKKLGQETIRGGKTDRYQFYLNGDEFQRYFDSLVQIIGSEYSDSVGDEDLLQNNPDVQRFIDVLSKTPVEVWINKDTNLLQRILLPIAFEKDAISFSINWQSDFYDYNEAIEIKAPEKSILLSQLAQLISQEFSNLMIVSGSEKAIKLDQDQDGLSDAFEALYGTDPKNKDSDGDGFDDRTELKNGYDPLGPGKLAS